MLNTLYFSLASLMVLPLCAQTTGNITYELPPSNHEWRLFMDNSTLNAALGFNEEDANNSNKENVDSTSTFQVFTHREGDALEILFVAQINNCDEESFDLNTSMGNDFNKIGFCLPNHKPVFLSSDNTEDRCIISYVWEDGIEDLMHGVACFFKTQDKTSILHYTTTASLSHENIEKWIAVLSQASSL